MTERPYSRQLCMPLGRSLRLLARPFVLPPASTRLSLYRTMSSTEHIEKKARTTEVCPKTPQRLSDLSCL